MGGTFCSTLSTKCFPIHIFNPPVHAIFLLYQRQQVSFVAGSSFKPAGNFKATCLTSNTARLKLFFVTHLIEVEQFPLSTITTSGILGMVLLSLCLGMTISCATSNCQALQMRMMWRWWACLKAEEAASLCQQSWWANASAARRSNGAAHCSEVELRQATAYNR